MKLSTLTLYLAAGGLSVALSLLLLAFARIQPGTRAVRGAALAIVMLAIAFIVSGFGPALPRATTVVGTNMLLLAASEVMYGGLAAFCAVRKHQWWGWGLIALTALPFWYWGLIEPNGNYRSIVFSWASAALTVRSAWILGRTARHTRHNAPIWVLASLFGILCAWMAARGVFLLFAAAPTPDSGANPTTWVTVFWFIVLLSVITFCFLWMEIDRLQASRREPEHYQGIVAPVLAFFGDRFWLLWSAVAIVILALAAETGVVYSNFYERELDRLEHAARVSNDTCARHTLLVVSQVDVILHAVRDFYLRTRSPSEVAEFIASLKYDGAFISGIYLISPQGRVIVPQQQGIGATDVSDRHYFVYHQTEPQDRIYIPAIDKGRVTGQYFFRLTRRITNPDGSFGGLVLANLNIEALAAYYRPFSGGTQDVLALLGTLDHKLRIGVPAATASQWETSLQAPLWHALQQAPSGSYKGRDATDGIARRYIYQQVESLPLVMVSGFSETDLINSTWLRLQPLALGALGMVLVVLVLATLLTQEMRRRREQERFMSMLNHELKTPMSVIRMALELDPLSASGKDHALQAVQDMNAIVDRCLQVDRLRQGRLVRSVSACSMPEVLEELRLACTQPQRVTVQAPPALPTLHTDAQLLRIIVGNLIDNALKYAAAGSTVAIQAWLAPEKHTNGIMVSVSNRPGAAGFPHPKQVFRKYYRSPHAHGKTGSGLGLYLAHSLARLLGGQLRYTPDVDVVRFVLWLPLVVP